MSEHKLSDRELKELGWGHLIEGFSKQEKSDNRGFQVCLWVYGIIPFAALWVFILAGLLSGLMHCQEPSTFVVPNSGLQSGLHGWSDASLGSPPQSQARFWDRTQVLTFAAETGLRGLDMGITCSNLAQPGGQEILTPWLDSCPKHIAWGAGSIALTTLVQYELYRHGWKRVARWLPVPQMAGNAIGAEYSIRHR